jgi:hypothetical protein
LIVTLRKSICANPANYATCDFAALITHMHLRLTEFDVNSLMLLIAMATVRSDFAILNAVALLSSSIQASLGPGLELPQVPQTMHFWSVASDFNLDCEDTLPARLTPCDLSVFDEIDHVDSITSGVHNGVLGRFRGVRLELTTEYVMRFVDAFVIFLLILGQRRLKASRHVVSVLVRSAVFNGAITIFEEPHANRRIVIILRNSAIGFLLSVQLHSIEDELKNLAASLPIFAEVIARVALVLRGCTKTAMPVR